MASANIEVIAEDREVKDLLRIIQERLSNLKPAMEIIGETAHASIMRNFERGGRPKWPKLSEVTKGQRKKKGKWPGQILRVSGALSRIVYQTFSDRVKIVANEKYAATQHFGAEKGSFGKFTVVQQIKEHMRKHKSGKSYQVGAHERTRKNVPVPWGDIPARPFLMVQKQDWDEIKAALGDFFLGIGRKK